MAEQEWLWLDSGKGSADFNMAFDEALLESMPRLGKPALRFYGWTERAASFGYFQKFAEVEQLTALRPLVRRPTGGGIVPHDGDWTYSLAFPTCHEWFSIKAIESYWRVHDWLRQAFVVVRLESELAVAGTNKGTGQCFAGFEQFDLLWNKRKIAGAAQRRRRDGMLIEGSVQPPVPTISRAQWQEAVCAAGARLFGVIWRLWTPDESLTMRATELAREKYSRRKYNERK